MVLRSVSTVISVYKNKTAEVGAQTFLQNFGYKRRGEGTNFGMGKKGWGNQNFSKILGGNQSLTHYVYYR